MNKLLIHSFLLAAFASTVSVSNAMTLGNYLIMKQRIASLPPEQAKHSRQVLDTYLEGIADGDVAVDSIKQYQQKKGGDYQPYSCAPAALPFDSKLVEKMIDAFNAANPDADKTVNVAILYVSQMAKTYPCK